MHLKGKEKTDSGKCINITCIYHAPEGLGKN